MSLTLGEKLRQAREERGISISEVAEQTRISPHYLELIEQDDYRTLPGGIFNKGFVKSYAKYVGIDEQEALQDYARLISSQEGDVSEEPKTYRPEVLTDDRSSSSIIPTIIIAIIILTGMTIALLYLVNYIQTNPTQPVANNNNTNANAGNTNSAVNANTATTPVPATNELKLELKPVSDTINVTYWIDGKMASKDVKPTEPLSLQAQQSLRISYYRGFTPDKIQLTLNGKQIAPPPAPARGNPLFEINKNNVASIMQSGQISADPASAANTAPR